ncbi:MAG TPA: protein-L-isoaspartate(D-aspartate) O-methyltransferase [Sedimenticola thiotaurini]|uniref:Protein-L-isoaspartate O-methyltransferase n=1 Tax=Sedimenticola thiotaurini TaxID=1543721 RepID=A0A831RPD2_9GAMM|nr:protein-L-isoaspartate(D-aspartate) O-methyltransferase [Sedimenticola thiotaurini]
MNRDQGRRQMLRDIEEEVAFTRSMTGRDHLDPRVMAAMAEVPREAFVPPELRYAAFDNGPLPIGHGQTISQPYIVALMTDLLEPQPEHRVLEIGTGSGYQTAILSRLCSEVYSIEVVPALTEVARRLFDDLGYQNIHLRVGNGYQGWPEHAPYDGIIVTAAASHVPPALVEQLKPGGRLVIPVGEPYGHQELMQLEKAEDGEIRTRRVLGVAFVPMVDRDPTGGT